MMRALDRKLLRDLGRMKTQAVAIALVVASGTALFIGTATTSRALRLSEEKYYDDHRFAHVWSRLARAPESVVRRLAAIRVLAMHRYEPPVKRGDPTYRSFWSTLTFSFEK